MLLPKMSESCQALKTPSSYYSLPSRIVCLLQQSYTIINTPLFTRKPQRHRPQQPSTLHQVSNLHQKNNAHMTFLPKHAISNLLVIFVCFNLPPSKSPISNLITLFIKKLCTNLLPSSTNLLPHLNLKAHTSYMFSFTIVPSTINHRP